MENFSYSLLREMGPAACGGVVDYCKREECYDGFGEEEDNDLARDTGDRADTLGGVVRFGQSLV